MSQLLAALLGEPPVRLGKSLQALEIGSAEPRVDIMLSSELLQTARSKMQQLGLDPADTTQSELYLALVAQFERDEEEFLRQLGCTATDLADILPRLVQLFSGYLNTPVWTPKRSVLKEFIKATPPKNVMKLLHYRSVASLAKNEPLPHILAAAHIVESKDWLNTFYAQYAGLQASHYVLQQPEIIPAKSTWLESQSYIDHVHQHGWQPILLTGCGAIVIPPPIGAYAKGLALWLLLSMTDNINQLYAASSYLKLIHTEDYFAPVAAGVGRHQLLPVIAHIAAQPVSWHQFMQAALSHGGTELIDPLEPRLSHSDCTIIDAEKILADMTPYFEWRVNTACLGSLVGDEAVSWNIRDAAEAYVLKLEFNERPLQWMRKALHDEIMERYLKQPSYIRQLHKQLDNHRPKHETYSKLKHKKKRSVRQRTEEKV